MVARLPWLVCIATFLVCAACEEPQPPQDPPSDSSDAGLMDADGSDADGDGPQPAEIVFPDDRFVVEVGSTANPSAEVYDGDGDLMEDQFIGWSSQDSSIIEISSGGMAIGQEIGETELVATVGDLEATWAAEVVGALAADVSVVPAESTLITGQQLPYDVNLRDESNVPIDDDRPVDWSVTDTDVATIDDDGLLTAQGSGEAEVIAVVDGVEGRADLTVEDIEIESIEITGASQSTLGYGQQMTLNVVAINAQGDEYVVTADDWSSSDSSIAGVDSQGIVFGMDVGEATITATVDDLEDSVDIEVTFNVSEIDCGDEFCCAVAESSLFCGGTNDVGQLANDSYDDSDAFGITEFDGDVESLSIGTDHGCLVDTSGDVHCWGDNMYGQLGHDDEDVEPEPVLVDIDATFDRVSAGVRHTCGLTTGDDVYCWGDNEYHQLGSSDENQQGPVQVASSVDFVDVAAGERHSCAVGTDESGYCWGANDRGQLGGSTDDATSASPSFVDGGYEFDVLTAGDDFTCGRSAGNPPACWGANDRGQLGVDEESDQDVPLSVPLDDGLTGFSAGAIHMCGTVSAGETRCWGAADDGRLGRDTADDARTPESAGFDEQFVDIASGAAHSCGLTPDDEVFCWGAYPGEGATPVEINFDL